MDKPLPQQLESFVEDMNEIEARDKHILWKIKGICSKVTYKLFTHYGNIKIVKEQDRALSQRFIEVYAIPLLESHLQMVFKRKTNFVGSVTLNHAVKYLSSATKIQFTMNYLLPYAENILFETIIPIMLITHSDAMMFQDNPIEYIRKQNDCV